MDLAANPFYTLEATMEDGRYRIAELADKALLFGDETSIREARGILTNPRKRLAAEAAWLPGLDPQQVVLALSMLEVNPEGVRRIANVPALARANLLASGLVRTSASLAKSDIVEWIVELSETHQSLDFDEITALLNEARSVAGFAAVSSRENVEEELQGRRRHFGDSIKRCLDQLPASSLVDAVTKAVDQTTQNGVFQAPTMIDDLIDTYEVEAQEFFDKETENLKTIEKRIREVAAQRRGKAMIDRLVTKLERVIKNWDYVAQPIQVSYSSRGLRHRISFEVAREIRGLAVDLWNEHRLLAVSQRLMAIQQEVFAEIAKIIEELDEDASVLNRIANAQENPIKIPYIRL